MFKRIIKYLGFAIIAILVVIISITRTTKHSKDEVQAYASQLFEFSSTGFAHGRVGPNETFSKVLDGEILNHDESCAYRATYSEFLQKQAGLFKLLDHNIHFAQDYGMNIKNNCDAMGIVGRNDIHDISARNNFESIETHLSELETANIFTKIYNINDINKDLADLMAHFAPAVNALGVVDQNFNLNKHDIDLESKYTNMVNGFKIAQFADVNSCDYWSGVDQALMNYVDIVMISENQIEQNSNWFERKIAGTWLALQTIAPKLNLDDPLRKRPAECP